MKLGRKDRKAMKLGPIIGVVAGIGTLLVLLVPPWHAPVQGHQLGYRAGSAIQWDQTAPNAFAFEKPPVTQSAEHYGVESASLTDTRPATAVYKNVQLAAGMTAGQFMGLQVAITNWVSPQQGCAFCHAGTDFSAETKPQKAAARVMIQMVRTVNADWREHVGEQGVTCFSCHRGQNVPSAAWYPRPAAPLKPYVAKQDDWLQTATTVRDFFPDAGFSEYLLQNTPGHSQSYTALPNGKGPVEAIVMARLYEVMMQMSDGIGVNCGYCHNSRAFFDWGQSTPARWIGLNGIHMTQAINNDFLLGIRKIIPQTRAIQGNGTPPATPVDETNPQNGNALATCQTCHYQNPKPLQGVNLLAAFPTLAGPAPMPAAAAAPPATVPAASPSAAPTSTASAASPESATGAKE